MKSYVTIYGELITGEVVREYENTVIVRTAKGGHHMVHKRNIDKGFKRSKSLAQHKTTNAHFDLERTQARGPLRNDMRHWSFK